MTVWLSIALLILVAAALSWTFGGRCLVAETRLTAASKRAQILAAVVTAIGIVVAGALYIIEQQWSPRFAVDVRSEVFPLRGPPSAALVQIAVVITNQGRTNQPIKSIEVAVQGMADSTAGAPDEFGDLPSQLLFDLRATAGKSVAAGETDPEYFEVVVPCGWNLIRVFTKVAQPPYGEPRPGQKRQVYERKLIVPLDAVCERAAEAR